MSQNVLLILRSEDAFELWRLLVQQLDELGDQASPALHALLEQLVRGLTDDVQEASRDLLRERQPT